MPELDASKPFQLTTKRLGRGALDVTRFHGEESLSSIYTYRIEALSAQPYPALEEALLGERAVLSLDTVAGPHVITGVVRATSSYGTSNTPGGRRTALTLELVPRLALLSERRTSRIFQDLSVSEIISQILGEWRVPHRFALAEPRSAWEHCVQYQESDHDFLCRLLAAEGIYFYFAFPPADDASPDAEEIVVFGDTPAAHQSPPEQWFSPPKGSKGLPVGGAMPSLRVCSSGAMSALDTEELVSWSRRRAIARETVKFRDYLAVNARFDLVADASGPRDLAIPSHIDGWLPPRPLMGNELVDDATTRRALEQARTETIRYEGAGNCRRLHAGHRLHVEHPDDLGSRGDHLVVRLVCDGRTPQLTDDTNVYEVRFDAIGAETPWRPPPLPTRLAPPLDTAVVVSPGGGDTHTDALGRVRVQFRWDLDRTLDIGRSCWLRVAQAWSGAGFGTHFLPRAGMEVLVSYLGGDINRPIIIGCAPNSSNPGPFSLPAEADRSGIVSRSTPRGDGGSAIIFDDTSASECLLITAQRDLETTVPNEHRTQVAGHQTINVAKDRKLTVEGHCVDVIAGDEDRTIGGHARQTISGRSSQKVAGHAASSYEGGLGVNVKGRAALHVDGDAEAQVNGLLNAQVEDDAIVRGGGHTVLLVGTHAAPRSMLLHVEGTSVSEATRTLELTSDEAIRLRCGDSSIVLTPTAIQLVAPKVRIDAGIVETDGDTLNLKASKLARLEGKKAFVLSQGASVCLTADVKIDGGTVYLKEPPDASDGPEARRAPPPPTQIKLTDQDGNALPSERYLLILDDGTERAGVLDENGEATVHGLEGKAKIHFPELPSRAGG
ncbi:type VI secretion system Vgr family protein [Chondromyces crocatus]|uniref:Uncharacterized protein n=1 Tax=Chondromyces crocatus TaxID=52 RepID=A0A0K1ES21_CHOCO|nr:type VI secretion system tip protein TssI/VgrG [Chondromyces crocatus]AKT43725.1 uncharacterized protein CMC5_079600 [Chondromyces crocatus]